MDGKAQGSVLISLKMPSPISLQVGGAAQSDSTWKIPQIGELVR